MPKSALSDITTMEKIDLITRRLTALSFFDNIFNDSVLAPLVVVFGSDDVEEIAISQFVSNLYAFNGGDLSQYIKWFIQNDNNIYIRTISNGDIPTKEMTSALANDLKTLQMIAEFDCEELYYCLDIEDFYPKYTISHVDLAEEYIKICKDADVKGYGIYRIFNMFQLDDDGEIIPINNPDKTSLSHLIGYEREHNLVIENTYKFLQDEPCQNVLLTGDAGTGKSSTIKAVVNKFADEGLRIIQIRKDQLKYLIKTYNRLINNPLKFIIFIDDISFNSNDEQYNILKMMLQGSLYEQPCNVLIYATSNKRHMIEEKFSDRTGDDIHINDVIQESISLSSRFGLKITFTKPQKQDYLDIVTGLASLNNIEYEDDKEKFLKLAEQFATKNGGRSPRTALQFIKSIS